MAGEDGALSVPWLRWPAIPCGLMTIGVAAVAWHERRGFGATFWFALAAAALYGTLSLLFNRTVLTVTAGELVVVHRPFPWRGRRIPVAHVAALELDPQASSENAVSGAVTWGVTAILRDGTRRSLLVAPAGGHSALRQGGVAAALASRLGVPCR